VGHAPLREAPAARAVRHPVKPARRRGLLLLCLALVCGGLAASEVRERERRVEAAIGPLVPVVVAADDLPQEHRLRSGDLAVRRLPARFSPPDAIAAREPLIGARIAVPVASGSFVTAGLLRGSGGLGGGLGWGPRAVVVSVAGGSALAGAQPGARVDVVVSTQGDAGGSTFVALEDVELLALGGGAGGGTSGAGDGTGGAGGGTGAGGGVGAALATLRVTARQAVYLTAAANFGQEIRLLLRPPGDRRRVGQVEVSAAGL
jgi:Flp pilus assembly protein CpaB